MNGKKKQNKKKMLNTDCIVNPCPNYETRLSLRKVIQEALQQETVTDISKLVSYVKVGES